VSPSPRDLLGLPMLAPRALRAVTDLLERLPEIEAAVVGAADRAQGTLDELLDRVRPIQTELQELQVSAKTLERQLAETERQFAETERQIAATDRRLAEVEALIAQLVELVIRAEGAAEHFLDKVPGLSAERAGERADEIARETERPDPPADRA
jgi:septal ring factor EnvC (AmiA/AmiB activator)